MSRFPKPYINNTKRDDSLMQYTTFPKTGIGARTSALPKEGKAGTMGLEHVGGTSGGSK